MYINDIHILYYLGFGILGITVGQLIDWCNITLSEHKQVFSKDFFNEGKDVLNEKVKLAILSEKELDDARTLINEKYSIYSDSDHLVPFDLLEQYCDDINSVAIPMKDIGHMGKKSGLEKLPKVIELINCKNN